MSEIVFDTSILVDHLRGVGKATELVENVRRRMYVGYISTVTEAELFSGKDVENVTRKLFLEDLLDLFSVVDVNREIARTAGEFRRKYGTNLADGIIASTAKALRCKLATKDIKDFKPIKEILIIEPY